MNIFGKYWHLPPVPLVENCFHFFSPEEGYFKPQSHYSDNQSPTSRSRQPSANYQQPISNQNFSPQSVADSLPTDRRLFADRSPSGRQPIANYLPTDYQTYFTFWNLISNHLESNRRLVADCLAWRDLHNLLNHPAFKEIPTFLRPYVDSSWIHVGISFEMRVIQLIM